MSDAPSRQRDDIDAIEALRPGDQTSDRARVMQMAPAIQAARHRKIGWSAIMAALRERGVNAQLATVQNYVRQAGVKLRAEPTCTTESTENKIVPTAAKTPAVAKPAETQAAGGKQRVRADTTEI